MKKFYNISEQGQEGIVDIFGDISNFANDEHTFKNDLDNINADNLTIRINSPGGDVFAGHSIYNMIKQTNKKTKVVVNGLAASIASVIAMAGDVVEMPSNAMMMIHNPSTYGGGTADEMRKTADVLDKVAESIKAVYVEKTGLSKDEITDMMTSETWLTAHEAKELGFCDVVTESVNIDNSINRTFTNQFKSVPKDFFNEDKGNNLESRVAKLEKQVSSILEQLNKKTEKKEKEKVEKDDKPQKVENGWTSFLHAKK